MMLLFSLALAETVTWNELQPTNAQASSWLQSNWNKYEENYHPNYAFDDDPATAWVEGQEGQGEGAYLRWDVSALGSARAVKVSIRNGYQKSAKLLEANAAPRVVRVAVGGAEVTAPLERKLGWQDIVVPLVPGQRVEHMRLSVVEATPGKVYADLCISDVKVYVDSEVPYNAAVETSKKEALLTWKKERVDKARAFAALPGDYPWAATRYTQEQGDATYAEAAALLAEARGLLLGMIDTDYPWYKLTARAAFQVPDGAPTTKGLPLRLGDVTFFAATEEVAGHGMGAEEPLEGRYNPYKEWWRSNHKKREVRVGDTTGTLVYWWERRIVEERGTYDIRERHVAWYGADERLGWHYSRRDDYESLSTYHWNTQGKIDRVDNLWASDARFSEYEEESYASRSTTRAAR